MSGSYSRVIRADTKKAGLLFAGTESGMYVTFDDGDNWQSLMLNLPNTSYRDIIVKDNDLVVGDIRAEHLDSRRHFSAPADDTGHLRRAGAIFKPERRDPRAAQYQHRHAVPARDAARRQSAARRRHLLQPRQRAAHHIAIDVLDAAGNVVRHYASDPIPPIPEPPPPVPDEWIYVPQPMATTTGMHRINWDLRYECRRHSFITWPT